MPQYRPEQSPILFIAARKKAVYLSTVGKSKQLLLGHLVVVHWGQKQACGAHSEAMTLSTVCWVHHQLFITDAQPSLNGQLGKVKVTDAEAWINGDVRCWAVWAAQAVSHWGVSVRAQSKAKQHRASNDSLSVLLAQNACQPSTNM